MSGKSNLDLMEEQLAKTAQILEKVKEQHRLVRSVVEELRIAKKADEAAKTRLAEAKKHSDWEAACKEHGINPDSSYNTFKIRS